MSGGEDRHAEGGAILKLWMRWGRCKIEEGKRNIVTNIQKKTKS